VADRPGGDRPAARSWAGNGGLPAADAANYRTIAPADIAWRHEPRISHVHCKDVRPGVLARARSADESFLDAVLDGVFTVPGDGGIDFGAVLIALKAADYRGWLVVEAEQDPAKAPPLVYARRGFVHLSAAVRETGW
jgi:inosose dehydratase